MQNGKNLGTIFRNNEPAVLAQHMQGLICRLEIFARQEQIFLLEDGQNYETNTSCCNCYLIVSHNLSEPEFSRFPSMIMGATR